MLKTDHVWRGCAWWPVPSLIAAGPPPHPHCTCGIRPCQQQSTNTRLAYCPHTAPSYELTHFLTITTDTLSPVYPDRPIRPLPKNRLKSRLSPEQSASLIYPPDPPISSLSFNFPFGASEKADARAVNGHPAHYGDQVTHCTCGGEHGEESDEEEIVYDHPNFRVQSPVEGLQQRRMLGEQMRTGKPGPPASTASSADGYESFENTSNKKKRKIPLSGSAGVHQSSLTAELANMGISQHGTMGMDGASDDMPSAHAQAAYQSATGMGHAGAGRGRAPKSSPMRRRERLSISHVTNGYPNTNEQSVERGGAYKGDGTKISEFRPHAAAVSHQPTDSGTAPQSTQEHKIISNAIANAQNQPTTPQKGRENVSLLSTASPKSATPKTQFTFTCESDSSNKMLWPGQPQPTFASPTPNPQQHHYAPPTAPAVSQSSQATQTGHMRGGSTSASVPAGHPQQMPPTAPGATAPPKKTRPRRPSREYALAARQRRLQQEYNNYHHKPTKENMWICEFCEYEDIWGVPPEALIRQYEIKDRAERKKAEEKRRLLEKAKMKGRKGKKGAKGKNNNQATAVANDQSATGPGAQQYDQHGGRENPPHSQDGQEEYYDDDYDDGYDPVEPNGGGPPLPHHHQQNVAQDQYHHTHGPPPPPPDKVAPPQASAA